MTYGPSRSLRLQLAAKNLEPSQRHNFDLTSWISKALLCDTKFRLLKYLGGGLYGSVFLTSTDIKVDTFQRKRINNKALNKIWTRSVYFLWLS
jgi:hypothetical protein